MDTREAWLGAAAKALAPIFADCGATIPESNRYSCGWPGGGSRHKRIGECWSQTASKDGVSEIFISPALDEPLRVLDILAHEIVHSIVGIEHGHKAPFKRLATAIGLAGKMTATHASPELVERLKPIADSLGPYPHGALNVGANGQKKQTTRLVKCECDTCGYIVRTTAKWLDDVGAPHCPNHGEMQVV